MNQKYHLFKIEIAETRRPLSEFMERCIDPVVEEFQRGLPSGVKFIPPPSIIHTNSMIMKEIYHPMAEHIRILIGLDLIRVHEGVYAGRIDAMWEDPDTPQEFPLPFLP